MDIGFDLLPILWSQDGYPKTFAPEKFSAAEAWRL
jgi:hypothetical protein